MSWNVRAVAPGLVHKTLRQRLFGVRGIVVGVSLSAFLFSVSANADTRVSALVPFCGKMQRSVLDWSSILHKSQ
jgi:hypothetical protein